MRLLETQVRLGWSKMAHSHMWYLVLVDRSFQSEKGQAKGVEFITTTKNHV